METPKRTFAKSLTWQALGLLTGTFIGWLFTGSLTAGGGIALTGAATGVVFFVLHERVWLRVRWGRRMEPMVPDSPATAPRA